MEDIFDIEKFNIIDDEENYYFFRALNMADNDDIENNITCNSNGEIQRIRTDRERYGENAKYNENSPVNLEQVFDHIKMHHRKDTNFISLSSNANVSALYGRGNYKDRYVIVKVPKKEMGEKVINAGQYMLGEIQNEVNKYIKTIKDEKILELFGEIDKSATTEEIKGAIQQKYKSEEKLEKKQHKMRKGIRYGSPIARISSYQALDEEQILEKNKIIAKLTLLERKAKMPPLVPHTSNNNFLTQTIGNAFSSMELLHYGDIKQEEILDIPKEIVDIFSLIQQEEREENKSVVKDLKKDVIKAIENKVQIPSLQDSGDKVRENIDIDEMYELTNGRVEYGNANSIVKNMFYLSKGQADARKITEILKQITNDNPKYKELIEDMSKKTFRIEPEIIIRQSNKGRKISESVSLDLRENEKGLIDRIEELSDEEQEETIRNGGLSNVRNIMNDIFAEEKRDLPISKNEYYAEAIFSLYDWKKIGIEEFKSEEKNNLIKKIQESDVVEEYKRLEQRGIDKKQIPTVLLNMITGKKSDLNDDLSIERIERFLGYYDVKNTQIQLRPYQQEAVEKTDEIFEKNRFASVILPTGGGKSFVALAELMQHQNQEILYLAPQNEIIEQMKDYIIKYIHGPVNTLGKAKDEIVAEVFPNLKFATYPQLLANGGREIVDKKYGFAILDELHRTGADQWGKKLDELLQNQTEDTKVLGITATPRRDADGLNMATEIAQKLGYTNKEAVSGKHIAINMSLVNAIRMGVVVNPKLVICAYNLKEDGTLDSLKEKIEQIKNIEERNEELKQYEKLRRNIENVDGVSKILKENVKKGGKYIVFLPAVEQVEDEDGNLIGQKNGIDKIAEYETQLMEYFKDSDIKPKIHSMFGAYGDKENEKRLEEFQKNNSDETDFMLVINKANEGLHLSKLNGIIWLRPLNENSRILYLQQLGRVIYSEDPDNPTKDEDRPVVIDLVNNTLKVDWENVITEQDDIEMLNLIIDWIENHDGILPNINSSNKEETGYASVLKEIQSKYKEYLQRDFKDLKDKQMEEIKEIIEIGSRINLWRIELVEKNAKMGNGKGKISGEEKLGPFEISGVLKDFVQTNQNVNEDLKLTPFEEVLEFCEENGRVPRFVNKLVKDQTEEEKLENSVYERWKRSDEKKIVDEYVGKKLEEIPEEDRKLVEQIREYGYGLTPFEEVLVFCEENGRIPKSIHKPAKDRTEEEKREMSLYKKWLLSDEKKIVDKCVGKKLEEIQEVDRKLVEQIREYGYGTGNGLTPFGEVLVFCEENGRVPKQIKKPAKDETEEEKVENSVYEKWKHSGEKKTVDEYVGKKLGEIPEKDRKLVQQMREYGYGIGNGLTQFEEVLEFCEENGRVPKFMNKPAKDKTGEERRENSLYYKWLCSDEKKIVDEYIGKKLEEIPEEDRKLVEQIREYGYGLTQFEEVLEFCEENGRVPKAIHKPAKDQTKEEKIENSVYEKWKRSDEKQIVDEYVGKKLEEIPEENRKLVEQIREYGYMGKRKRSAKEIAKASISSIKDMDMVDSEEQVLKKLIEKEQRKEGEINLDEQ